MSQNKVTPPPGQGRRGKPEPTLQMNIRLGLESSEQLEALIAKTGMTKREAIQEAIELLHARHVK